MHAIPKKHRDIGCEYHYNSSVHCNTKNSYFNLHCHFGHILLKNWIDPFQTNINVTFLGDEDRLYKDKQRVVLLLMFLENLEKLLYNASEGCAVAITTAPKVTSIVMSAVGISYIIHV